MSEVHSKYIFQKQPNTGAALEATVGGGNHITNKEMEHIKGNITGISDLNYQHVTLQLFICI